MSKKITHCHIILDQSGSMEACKPQTISGFNEYLQHFCGLSQQYPHQEFSFGLTLFDSEVQLPKQPCKPCEISPLTSATYRTGGLTALLDAIGLTIQQAKKNWLDVDEDTSATVMVAIVTDGFENASKVFTHREVSDLISRLEATGQWTFHYVGTTFEGIREAANLSIRHDRMLRFDIESMKTGAWDKLSGLAERYVQYRESDK